MLLLLSEIITKAKVLNLPSELLLHVYQQELKT